ncbi:hypothetical protein ZTR_10420 [Talaromyces verruculosus]|nr:hypothetical protein ZTR_10420 [Talaromyces verruculosus]
MPGETWEISYADGSGCGGIVFKDDVSIGTSTSVDQGVEVALYVSPEFAVDYFSNGLVGLAFSSLNTEPNVAFSPTASPVQQLTYFENILPTLEEPLFTANLKHGEPGNYNFGYIDPTEYSGSIAWTPVTTPYGYYAYWQLDLSGYQISSEPYIETPINGIADTGTTLLYLPIDVVTAYYAAVTGSVFDEDQAAWLFPCSATLPDFIFGIADYRGIVPGDYMNYAPVDDVWCYGGIQPNTGLPFSIFGDILLKAQFVVFDHSGPRLGFANKL